MDFTTIVNPKTHRKVAVQSNKGASIIAGYLSRLHQKERKEKQSTGLRENKHTTHAISDYGEFD